MIDLAIVGMGRWGRTLVTPVATAPDFRRKLFGTAGSAELSGPKTLVFKPIDGVSETTTFDPRAELEACADAITGHSAYPVPLDEVPWGIAAFEGISRSIAEGGTVAVPMSAAA